MVMHCMPRDGTAIQNRALQCGGIVKICAAKAKLCKEKLRQSTAKGSGTGQCKGMVMRCLEMRCKAGSNEEVKDEF